jgi:hypothetical protein
MIFDHLENGEPKEAEHSLDDLKNWVGRGGFLPTFPEKTSPMIFDEWWGVLVTLSRWITSELDKEQEQS